MSRKNYTGVSLKNELLKQVDNHIKKYPELAYCSRAEFIKCAIRSKLLKEK